MEQSYKNKNTSSFIKENDIIRTDNNDLIVSNKNCWKLIPADEVEFENSYSEYYNTEQNIKRVLHRKEKPFLAYKDNTSGNYTEKIERRFGFRNLSISTKQAAKTSVIISDNINVNNISYITISCLLENKDNGSLEISIIDNNDEIPILPNGVKWVYKEKLFYDQNTRFFINNNKPITLYEDNAVCSKLYTDLTMDDFKNHTYTLTYVALGDVVKYKPVTDKIQLKLVIRQYTEYPLFTVKGCMVNNYGGVIDWNLKA